MRRSKKTVFFLAGFVLSAIMLVSIVRMSDKGVFTKNRFAAQFKGFEEVGGEAMFPSFVLHDLQGNTVVTDSLLGNDFVLVNIWASWCAPCIAEMPTLRALEESFAEHAFKVIYISLDYPQGPDDLKDTMKMFSLEDIPSYYVEDKGVWPSLSIKGLPTTFLVSPEKRSMYKMLGDTNWKSSGTISFLTSVLYPDETAKKQ